MARYPPQKTIVLSESKFLEVMRFHAWNVVKELYAVQSHQRSKRAPKNFPLLSRGGRALGFDVQLPNGSWEEVEKGLQQWHIFKPETEMEQSREFREFLNQIKKAHTILLGRIRWTNLFAEELLQVSSAVGGKLTAQEVNKATEQVADRVKHSLRERIDQFKYTHWVDELYWTAIEADVYSMTRIFSDEESVKLISEGFASVHEELEKSVKEGGGVEEKKVIKGRLQEPLAVKAVMEYLRDPNNGGLYGKLMDRFFASLQFDRGQGGSLGKLAEYVFTAVSITTISNSWTCYWVLSIW